METGRACRSSNPFFKRSHVSPHPAGGFAFTNAPTSSPISSQPFCGMNRAPSPASAAIGMVSGLPQAQYMRLVRSVERGCGRIDIDPSPVRHHQSD